MMGTQRASEDVLKPEIHAFSLSFGGPLEREFMADYLKKSLGQVRLTLLIGTLFYCSFGILDAAVVPGATKTLWAIRFGGFLPFSAVIYLLTYQRLFDRVWQGAMALWGLAGGLGILGMIGAVQGEAGNSYYAGLILIFIVLYTWSRVRFIWATLTGWLIVVAFEALMIGVLHSPSQVLWTNNFFFIGANILGMLACYSIERYARADFLMARLLQEEQEKVRRVNKELKERNEELKGLAEFDDLTRIPNRRMFEQELKRGWRRMVRTSHPLTLLLCDVDSFKAFTDTYGHQAGDECLVKIAVAVQGSARRPGDYAARYGGEEFAVILQDTGIEGAQYVAERICQTVRNLGIVHAGSTVAKTVTISVGAATIQPTHEREPEALVRKADECLYQAKGEGRNRVVVAKA
ncbi:MAG: diguanylate cyclase [Candidatus Aminicenantales bacterium]